MGKASDRVAAIRAAARDIRTAFVDDPRREVFEVRARAETLPSVRVESTLPEAGLAFARRLQADGIDADIHLRVLPDPTLQPRGEALVRAGLAPMYVRPTMNSTLMTQYAMGHRLTLLGRRGRFWRVRGEDGHVGWVHFGYLLRGELEWALAWERAEGRTPLVSLGAELEDETGVFARLPWGARVLQEAGGRVLLPDGRTGTIAAGELVAIDRLRDRFPPRGESVIRTARRWLGVPYLWGGVTVHGVDCSGLAQSTYWLHGLALPRDSDMQIAVGMELDTEVGDAWSGLRPADLLFFAEDRQVNHVALSLGGSRIIHASATNGGVAMNDLAGDAPIERILRDAFVGARRLLPDD